jgi:hypothetical protein
LGHIEQCAAIAEIEAEIETGVTAENSLFAVPEGMSHVQSTIMFFNDDECPDDLRARRRDKERKEKREERKTERKRKEEEAAASAALLSLKSQKRAKTAGKEP